ncbi:hypothetical protein [Mitsuaria sp. GD03876]|uniref:hypothetical protein n=1 Tax=Mitsuaria sp. GD03876 TaxID=2975399 RepID=UPI0024499E7B|nr:hypothetical protein [Mitsuaria sp. GD03876]MDH0868144.1 hypothetical protein [Mitsuaria sp. GD03876]
MSSRFVTEDLARAALEAITPAIAAQLASPDISGLGVLHLVVLDPSVPYGDGATQPRVLVEHSIGDRAHWDVDYADYARRKALLSWRHRMDSRRLQMLEPHRLTDDDSQLWGGIWLDGLVVAASGAFPIWDECFSMMVAVQLRARAWAAADLAR